MTSDIALQMQQLSTGFADWAVILPVALALIGAATLMVLRNATEMKAAFAFVVVAAIAVCDAMLLARTLADGPVAMTMGNWLPPFGIGFAADVLGAGFALAAALVTLVVVIYLQMDKPADDATGPDDGLALVLLLLAGVSGAFLTGDLFNLYVWFEVMLIASFGLLAGGGRDAQLDGTLKYGFLNFLATAIFLAALGLIYGLTGTLNMADLVAVAPRVDAAAMTGLAALLLLAFGIKAAAFPLNAWLPASYHTPPAAISALLGGLLTKVGVYALLRVLVGVLPLSRDWLGPAIAAVAILTLVIAPLGAIAETNLRRALGFLLIGGIGASLAGLALPTQNGIGGAALYGVQAMLVMAALYLVAGLIERLTGATDTRAMGGLYAANTPVSVLFLVLVLTVAGVPPFLGFWPKLLLLQAGIESANLTPSAGTPQQYLALLLVVALLVNALLTLIAGTRLWAHMFWRAGPEGALSEQADIAIAPLGRRQHWLGLVPVALLVAAIVLLGLLPDALVGGATAAGRDLLDPGRYVGAVGLGGGT